jgi:DNA-binding CsgD family transcriptional regulator
MAMMKRGDVQWRFGRAALGWGAALAAGMLLLVWADWQRVSHGPAGDLALVVVAALFLGLGLWLGFSFWKPITPPAGNPAAIAALGITPREVEVLALLAMGQSNKAIARALGVSPNTVKTHLARLYAKLGASSRTAAIAQARGLGIIGGLSGDSGPITHPGD